jgi:hypothetical protein
VTAAKTAISKATGILGKLIGRVVTGVLKVVEEVRTVFRSVVEWVKGAIKAVKGKLSEVGGQFAKLLEEVGEFFAKLLRNCHESKLVCNLGRRIFGQTTFSGLIQNRALRDLTDTEIRSAFRGTPFQPSNHAISRLLHPRTTNVGIHTLNDVARVLNSGEIQSAGGGLLSIQLGNFEAIVNPVTKVIVTFSPM